MFPRAGMIAAHFGRARLLARHASAPPRGGRTRRGKEPIGMESSTVLAFRIFVMLSCLVIVPLAAIFGSAFPDVVKSVLVDRIVAWSTGKPVEARHASDPAGFREVTPPGAVAAAPDSAPPWNAPRAQVAPWPGPAPSQAVAAGPSSPAAVSASNPSASLAAHVQPPTPHPAVPQAQQPVDEGPYHRNTSLQQPASAESAPAAASPSAFDAQAAAASATEQPDRFSEMERKLREYGATYYLLETWGNDGQLFRFHCRMAVGDNPNYTRHFEATDRDALAAMAQVLERVEAWRAGRLP
jgi:hypothetical protein